MLSQLAKAEAVASFCVGFEVLSQWAGSGWVDLVRIRIISAQLKLEVDQAWPNCLCYSFENMTC